MVLSGPSAIEAVRYVVGDTDPLKARPGTIRGDFTLDSYAMADMDQRSVRNLIHASGNVHEAEQEIAIWFNQEEILNYNHLHEKILYDVNLDGIKE